MLNLNSKIQPAFNGHIYVWDTDLNTVNSVAETRIEDDAMELVDIRDNLRFANGDTFNYSDAKYFTYKPNCGIRAEGDDTLVIALRESFRSTAIEKHIDLKDFETNDFYRNMFENIVKTIKKLRSK